MDILKIAVAFLLAGVLGACATGKNSFNPVHYMAKERIEAHDLPVANPEWASRSAIVYKYIENKSKDVHGVMSANGFKLLQGQELFNTVYGNTLVLMYSYKNNNFRHPMWFYYAGMNEVEFYVLTDGGNSLAGPRIRGAEYQDTAVCSIIKQTGKMSCLEVFEREYGGAKERLCNSGTTGRILPCYVKAGRQLPDN